MQCVGLVGLWAEQTVLHRGGPCLPACLPSCLPACLHSVAGIFPRGCVTLIILERQTHQTSC